MKIEINDRELSYESFVFPDGQRHIKILDPWYPMPLVDEVTITTRLKNADDILDLLLVADIFTGFLVNVNILYLLGARMDRHIDDNQPHTLFVVARMLNSASFNRVRILDPHSPSALDLINHSEEIYPYDVAKEILEQYDPADSVIVIPDAGAIDRVDRLLLGYPDYKVVRGSKDRDLQTGKLSGFSVLDPTFLEGKNALIIDDICDGGGTFVGLAEVLHNEGAKDVDLFVTHGIFSKGRKLNGINMIYTTNSYEDWMGWAGFIPIRVNM